MIVQDLQVSESENSEISSRLSKKVTFKSEDNSPAVRIELPTE